MRFALLAFLLCSSSIAVAQQPAWVNLKGQVVLPAGDAVPAAKPLAVAGANGPACLAKGPLLDESVIVNPKNRGIKNVVVWLRPNNQEKGAAFTAKEIHPADAKRKPAPVVIDQPCCQFVPRVLACRVGDTIVVNNPAAFAHNFFWTSNLNGNLNINIPANGKFAFQQPLVAETAPILYKCTAHPWMQGYVRIFDHPYYAVTDADGRFEIANAPAGNYRIVYWQETVGFKDGKNGRFGAPVTIAGDAKNTMELKPTDFKLK